MLESGIGRAHNLALAALPGFTLPGDLSASARYYARDIVTARLTIAAGGTAAVPDGPGIGVEWTSTTSRGILRWSIGRSDPRRWPSPSTEGGWNGRGHRRDAEHLFSH